eukprot:CAMPEP_0184017000 /NCGR_PEP_ID=MMETSP0954-20121128/7260_1 /TAXON_ID=627963 /ORGANISM="Aplanochytrium sp, Strain PBS07" /LENGTH=258 /DNA_ID=CAMNT_0026298121 /DNA_START=141 /DNA_END=918 /DNA_ORIENTATION=+
MLRGKVAAAFGVSNEKSIGWSVAKAWMNQGAKVIISVESERFLSKVSGMCEKEKWDKGDYRILQCDVSKDVEIGQAIRACSENFGGLDALLHSVAFSPKPALESVLHCNREDFRKTFDISCIQSNSVVARSSTGIEKPRRRINYMPTFNGSERAIPGYGLMGPAKGALESACRYIAAELGQDKIRVNALSPGPLNTLAARGIPNFHQLRQSAEAKAPLNKQLTQQDVGDVAAFLASDMAQAITGQTLHVDCGYSIVSH